jgi:hypothetical protein
MKKYQNGGPTTKNVAPAKKVTPVKKASPPKSTMDLIRGSKKSDYTGTVTQYSKKGGAVKKYQEGGSTGFDRRQAKKVAKAETRAKVASIEGEGTVAQKRDNRAQRVAVATGTARAKTPKSVSTSTSTTTTNNTSSVPKSPAAINKTIAKPGMGKTPPKTGVTKGPGKEAFSKTPSYAKDSIKNRTNTTSPVRYQKGGSTKTSNDVAKQIVSGVKKDVKSAVKNDPIYKGYKAAGRAMKSVDDSLQKRYPNYTGKGSFYDGAKSAVKSVMGYKKGGMTKSKK